MDLLFGTLLLRPYVFGFLAAFLLAGAFDIGWRRTLRFGAWVGPVAWLSEFSSTRTGVPFGLYHYTGTTRGQELFIADVPFMDCLSFTFLAYASFCLARATLRAPQSSAPVVTLLAGALMMLLDVVIDPAAVRGDRWFLGPIFFYPEGGVYFGVPVSNFVGWLIVGMVGVGGYVYWSEWREHGQVYRSAVPASTRAGARMEGRGAETPFLPVQGGSSEESGLTALRSVGMARGFDRHGRRVWPGIALYYAVLAFNLAVTGWIGEWLLLGVGAAVHAVAALLLWNLAQRPAARLGLEKKRA
jgi:Carotenoid biosynthesis protein